MYTVFFYGHNWQGLYLYVHGNIPCSKNVLGNVPRPGPIDLLLGSRAYYHDLSKCYMPLRAGKVVGPTEGGPAPNDGVSEHAWLCLPLKRGRPEE